MALRNEQDKVVRELTERLSVQEREMGELFGKLQKRELEQAFE